MYRDEQEALKARRDALKRETAEVDAQLKLIATHRRQKIVKFLKAVEVWKCACENTCAAIVGGAVIMSFAFMWTMIICDTPPNPELAPDSDASACEEHGQSAIPQSPEEAVQTLEDAANTSCDGADNNCDTTNDNGLDIIFVLDTSGSMSSYLEDAQWTIGSYTKGATAASYALMTTFTDNWLGVPFLTRDRETFNSLVSQSRINPSVDEEYTPLRMEEAANLGHNMVVAFTDEPPMVPAGRYYDYVVNRRMGHYGLCARNNDAAFTVFTTPQNVAAWRELGSCVRVYGEL